MPSHKNEWGWQKLLQNPGEGLLTGTSRDGAYVRVRPVCTIHKVQLECTGNNEWHSDDRSKASEIPAESIMSATLLMYHNQIFKMLLCTHRRLNTYVLRASLFSCLFYSKCYFLNAEDLSCKLCKYECLLVFTRLNTRAEPASFVTHQSLLQRQGTETRLSCIEEWWAETKTAASVRRTRASRSSPIKFQ